jgi:hypothetical protein
VQVLLRLWRSHRLSENGNLHHSERIKTPHLSPPSKPPFFPGQRSVCKHERYSSVNLRGIERCKTKSTWMTELCSDMFSDYRLRDMKEKLPFLLMFALSASALHDCEECCSDIAVKCYKYNDHKYNDDNVLYIVTITMTLIWSDCS